MTLGPEQTALVGFGEYGRPGYELGIQHDVVIPGAIRRLEAGFVATGHNEITADVLPPSGGPGPGKRCLRIFMTQSRDGVAYRSTGGSPPDGRTLGTILRLSVQQDGRELPVRIEYDKAIWSGLSWAAGEVSLTDVQAGSPLRIICSSAEPAPLDLAGELYEVTYAG